MPAHAVDAPYQHTVGQSAGGGGGEGQHGLYAQPSITLAATSTVSRPTQVFVGGLQGSVLEAEFREVFEPYGDVLDVKIIPNKNFAFVTFANLQAAEAACQGVCMYACGVWVLVLPS